MSKHRKPSMTRKALRNMAAIVAMAAAGFAGMATSAGATDRPVHQCWPLAHGKPGTGLMCVPAGRGLRWWSWTPETSQAWEDRMHYLECRDVGTYKLARGLVFGCTGTPAPKPFPAGLWSVIGRQTV